MPRVADILMSVPAELSAFRASLSEESSLPSELDSVVGRARAQAKVTSDRERIRARGKDVIWANYVEFERMISASPYPRKRFSRRWDLGGGRVQAAAAEGILVLVGRNPENFVASDRINW